MADQSPVERPAPPDPIAVLRGMITELASMTIPLIPVFDQATGETIYTASAQCLMLLARLDGMKSFIYHNLGRAKSRRSMAQAEIDARYAEVLSNPEAMISKGFSWDERKASATVATFSAAKNVQAQEALIDQLELTKSLIQEKWFLFQAFRADLRIMMDALDIRIRTEGA